MHDGSRTERGTLPATAYKQAAGRLHRLSGFRPAPVPPANRSPCKATRRARRRTRSIRHHGARPRAGTCRRRIVLPSEANCDGRPRPHGRKDYFEAAEPIESVGIPMLAGTRPLAIPSKEQPVLVQTGALHELNQQHHVVKVFTLPADDQPRTRSIAWDQERPGHRNRRPAVVDTGGQRRSCRQMVYRIKVMERSRTSSRLTCKPDRPPNKQLQALWMALGCRFQGDLMAIGLFVVIVTGHPQGYAAAVAVLLKDSGLSMIAVLALSIVLAILAHRRSRAFGLSGREQISWSVLVLLSGLPAYVGFRLYRRWPIRRPCPSCPRSGSPRPCGVRGADTISGSCVERNRDLRLKRRWSTRGG